MNLSCLGPELGIDGACEDFTALCLGFSILLFDPGLDSARPSLSQL